MQDSIWSVLPPLLAILIAIVRRNALIALLSGVFMCFWMAASWNVLSGIKDTAFGILGVFDSAGNTRIVAFSLLIGALVELMNRSGAVNGFIDSLARLSLVKSKRQASMLPTLVGTSIFTDTNLSMFSAGMASQKLFDSHQMSRVKLAYLVDSTCAPISILVLVNGWGAYVLGLLNDYDLPDVTGVLIGTIGYNFYAIIAVVFAFYTAYSGRTFGAMKIAEQNMQVSEKTKLSSADSIISNSHHLAPEGQAKAQPKAKARVMWLPMLSLLAITLGLLWYSGNGDIRRGSGSYSVFWAIVSALVIQVLMIAYYRLMSVSDVILASLAGIKKMAPAVMILVLSFAFGDGIKSLGTGLYISHLLSVDFWLPLIAPVIFIAAALMAFSTGTSWGTFAILIPIAVPLSMSIGLPPEFLVAAVLSGGIFGDHASPISDTTVVASIASGCDHYEHVRTQLPYALVAGMLAISGFFVTSFLLSA